MNHRELPELLEIEFEAVLPGRKQDDQLYTQYPIIRNFLEETVRERSVVGKRILVDYLETAKNLHKTTMNKLTYAFCATVGLPQCHLVENLEMCWKAKGHARQRRSKLRLISHMHAQMHLGHS